MRVYPVDSGMPSCPRAGLSIGFRTWRKSRLSKPARSCRALLAAGQGLTQRVQAHGAQAERLGVEVLEAEGTSALALASSLPGARLVRRACRTGPARASRGSGAVRSAAASGPSWSGPAELQAIPAFQRSPSRQPVPLGSPVQVHPDVQGHGGGGHHLHVEHPEIRPRVVRRTRQHSGPAAHVVSGDPGDGGEGRVQGGCPLHIFLGDAVDRTHAEDPSLILRLLNNGSAYTPALMASRTPRSALATAGASSSGMWSIAWEPNEIRYCVIHDSLSRRPAPACCAYVVRLDPWRVRIWDASRPDGGGVRSARQAGWDHHHMAVTHGRVALVTGSSRGLGR